MAKHMMTLWKEKKLLHHVSLQGTQSLVDEFNVPSDIGRIPYKISSGYSSFTADQWKIGLYCSLCFERHPLFGALQLLENVYASLHLAMLKSFYHSHPLQD